jgi:hypothetical protein
MDENAPTYLQILFPLISGVGIGMLFHPPYQVFLRTLESHEVAAGTSAFFLVRFTGATIGLVRSLCLSSEPRWLTQWKAVAGTVFNAKANIPDLRFPGSSTSIDFSKIKDLALIRKEEVIHIIASAIRVSFYRMFLVVFLC